MGGARIVLGVRQGLVMAFGEPNTRGPGGDTALMSACSRPGSPMAALLLEYGADPNLQNDWGMAAGHALARRVPARLEADCSELLELLECSGIDWGILDQEGKLAEDWAFATGKRGMGERIKSWRESSELSVLVEVLSKSQKSSSL